MQPGLAYNSSVATYVPSNPRTYAPTNLELSFRADKSVATLTWSDKNGELNDSMWIERRVGTDKNAAFEYYKGIALNDDAASYTFQDTVATSGYYTYRVAIRTFNNRLLYTNEVVNNIAGTTSVGKDEQRGSLQYGAVTTGSSNEAFLYFADSFTEQPAIVFGSLSNRTASMMPLERVSNIYTVKDDSGERKYSYFRYSIYPFNQVKSSSTKTDFYNDYTDYTSYLVAKAGTGKIGNLNYEAGVSDNCAANDTVDVTFTQEFAEAPVVLVSPIMAISTTERYPVLPRVFDVTTSGCKVVLQRQQALNESNAIKRTVKFSYVAFEKGQTKDEAGKLITVKDTIVSFTSKTTLGTDIAFGEKLKDAAFLIQMQTLNNPALAVLRTRPLSLYQTTDSTGTRLRLQVDDTSTETAAFAQQSVGRTSGMDRHQRGRLACDGHQGHHRPQDCNGHKGRLHHQRHAGWKEPRRTAFGHLHRQGERQHTQGDEEIDKHLKLHSTGRGLANGQASAFSTNITNALPP